jgi:hypothetical protein
MRNFGRFKVLGCFSASNRRGKTLRAYTVFTTNIMSASLADYMYHFQLYLWLGIRRSPNPLLPQPHTMKRFANYALKTGMERV